MSKYAELDAAIVRAIRDGHCVFWSINRGDVSQCAIAVKPDEPWRAVDGRLQALKRAGRIHFTRANGWVLTAAEKA